MTDYIFLGFHKLAVLRFTACFCAAVGDAAGSNVGETTLPVLLRFDQAAPSIRQFRGEFLKSVANSRVCQIRSIS